MAWVVSLALSVPILAFGIIESVNWAWVGILIAIVALPSVS